LRKSNATWENERERLKNRNREIRNAHNGLEFKILNNSLWGIEERRIEVKNRKYWSKMRIARTKK